MHTWDLARATGQDDTLDPERCAEMLAGMEPIEDVMRGSGQYGARVDVPADADVQTGCSFHRARPRVGTPVGLPTLGA